MTADTAGHGIGSSDGRDTLLYLVDRYPSRGAPLDRARLSAYACIVSHETPYGDDWRWEVTRYRPASQAFDEQLAEGVDEQLLDVHTTPTFGGDIRYAYSLTDRGQDRVAQVPPPPRREIKGAVDPWDGYPLTNMFHELAARYDAEYRW